MVFPVNFRKSITWSKGSRPGGFRPNPGVPTIHGVKHNPSRWDTDSTDAARLVIGFNIGLARAFTLAQVIDMVKEIRLKQVGFPNSSFLSQEGIYTYQKGPHKGEYTQEKGCQVILLNVPPADVPLEKFYTDVIECAELLCKALSQEEIVVEIQHNGVVVKTMGIGL